MHTVNSINLKQLTLNNNQLTYNGKPFQLISDYYDAYLGRFKSEVFLSIRIPTDDPLHTLLFHIDTLMEKVAPKDLKHVHLVRQYKDANGGNHVCAVPKIKLATLYDKDKKPITIDDVLAMKKFKCRFIGSFSKVNKSRQWFSISLYGNQLQVIPAERSVTECMFD